jgi:hypothetical protein
MRRAAKRLITIPLLIAASFVIVLEELQWRLAIVYKWLGRLPLLRHLETAVSNTPPYGALFLLALPATLLFPLKLLALYWLAHGRATLAMSAIVFAKVFGTALVARLFQLTRTQLLSIAWFKWAFDHFMALRQSAYDLWRNSAIGRYARRRFHVWRERYHLWKASRRSWLALRWEAIKIRLRHS